MVVGTEKEVFYAGLLSRSQAGWGTAIAVVWGGDSVRFMACELQ